MKVISGSLPPGLQFGEPICEWTITGTPTKAGTYSFTVQITPQPNNLGQIPGPSGTQQLTITIGTGSSDRPVVRVGYNGHQFRLVVTGYDANISALWSVSVTSTGKALISNQPNFSTADDGFLELNAHLNDPCGAPNSCNLTVKRSLGSSVTVTLGPAWRMRATGQDHAEMPARPGGPRCGCPARRRQRGRDRRAGARWVTPVLVSGGGARSAAVLSLRHCGQRPVPQDVIAWTSS